MDCSLPGSSIHGIFSAKVLEWGAIAFSSYIAQYVINKYVCWLNRRKRTKYIVIGCFHYALRNSWEANEDVSLNVINIFFNSKNLTKYNFKTEPLVCHFEQRESHSVTLFLHVENIFSHISTHTYSSPLLTLWASFSDLQSELLAFCSIVHSGVLLEASLD